MQSDDLKTVQCFDPDKNKWKLKLKSKLKHSVRPVNLQNNFRLFNSIFKGFLADHQVKSIIPHLGPPYAPNPLPRSTSTARSASSTSTGKCKCLVSGSSNVTGHQDRDDKVPSVLSYLHGRFV